MRKRGEQVLQSTLDDKLKALREEARTGYAKEDIRRTYIKEELYAQRDAREREAKKERERIKEECLADWKARNTNTTTTTTTTTTSSSPLAAAASGGLRHHAGAGSAGAMTPLAERGYPSRTATPGAGMVSRTSTSTPSGQRRKSRGEGGGDASGPSTQRCGTGGLRSGLLSVPVSIDDVKPPPPRPAPGQTSPSVCTTVAVGDSSVNGDHAETNGLALLGAPWMSISGEEGGEEDGFVMPDEQLLRLVPGGGGDATRSENGTAAADGAESQLTDGILSIVRQFQAETLPVLEAAAAEFKEDFTAEVERHRVLERDHLTGMPSLLAVDGPVGGGNDGDDADEDHDDQEEGDYMLGSMQSSSIFGPRPRAGFGGAAYDVFALTPQRGDTVWRERAASVSRGGARSRRGSLGDWSTASSPPIAVHPSHSHSQSSGHYYSNDTTATSGGFNGTGSTVDRFNLSSGIPTSGMNGGGRCSPSVGSSSASAMGGTVGRRGGPLAPRRRPPRPQRQGEIVSGIVVAQNEAKGILRSLKRQGFSFGGSQRAASAGGADVGSRRATTSSHRPSTASSQSPSVVVARVVRPMLLLVCNHCRHCFDCDATSVVLQWCDLAAAQEQDHTQHKQEKSAGEDAKAQEEAPPRLLLDVSCPSCQERVQVSKEVADHYATRLFPAPRTTNTNAEEGGEGARPRGLLYTCDLDEDGNPATASPAASSGVGTETVQTNNKKKKTTTTTTTTTSTSTATTTTCGVGTGEENAYTSEAVGVGVGVVGHHATTVAVGCGGAEDEDEHEASLAGHTGGTQTTSTRSHHQKKEGGSLPFPIALPHAVKGVYFSYLWDLWEAEQDHEREDNISEDDGFHGEQ